MWGRFTRQVPGLFALIVVLAARVCGDELPVNRAVGQRMTDFSLKSTTGQTVALDDYRMTTARFLAGKFENIKQAVVIVFMGIDCPVGNLYAPRLVELNQHYKNKGVAFLAIDSNAHDSLDQMAQYAKENKLDFPFLKDSGNVVADEVLVERTCEVLVLEGMRGRIVYRGAIDDQYGVGTRKDKPTHDYLREALDAVLSKKPVPVAATRVVGCLIDRIEPKLKVAGSDAQRVREAPPQIVEALKEQDEKAAAQIGTVTYSHDVAAILQEKCQLCHRPLQVAPFALLSYDDARRHSGMIEEVVESRRMPPWHADPRYGHFSNDRSLTPVERAKLLAWVHQGAPLGDPNKMPPPKKFADGWLIGKPDIVFEIPEPYTVPAQGVVEYVDIDVPTHFKEDMWVQAGEARPGDRSVVHHIVVFIAGSDPSFLINDDMVEQAKRRQMAQQAGKALSKVFKGTNKAPDKAQFRPRGRRSDGGGTGDGGLLCGYAPGDIPLILPEGSAKKIPAGATLRFQIHYTPNGKIRTDRSKVGLIFAKSPVKYRVRTVGVAQLKFQIPAGAADYPVAASFTLPNDTRIVNFMPHMHLRGKSFEYKATYPNGKSEILLSVPAFDFGWQSYYNLAEPKFLPKGTKIDCLAHFDNSSGNPANPDPHNPVTWGDQTFEEMMIGYTDMLEELPQDSKATALNASPSRAPARVVRP